MLRKLAIGISFAVGLTAAAALAGCGGERDYDREFADKVKVVYELEGGKYLNSTTSVNHYYDYKDNLRITPLEEFSKEGVTRDGGFTFNGWYRTKTADGEGNATYSDLWNFATDTVTREGVILYAKWDPPIIYSFDFIYFENGEEKVAGSYRVNEGNKFGDVWTKNPLTYANYPGHTAIELYYDKDFKEPFDDSRVHPGGEVSTAVKLYAKYIEGDFTLVSTASELRSARSGNIYLLDDIDMKGAKLSFTSFKGKKFFGNNHKVSNFVLDYGNTRGDLAENLDDGRRNALCIGIFGNADGAEVKDVTFENVTLTIDTFLSDIKKIYVAPLAAYATDSRFENVKVSGTFGYKTLPTLLDTEKDLIFKTDAGFVNGVNSTETGCSYEITLAGKVN